MNRLLRCLVALALALASSSCTLFVASYLDKNSSDGSADSGEGALVLSIDSAGVKILLPSIDMTPASYRIRGQGPSDKSFEESTPSAEVMIPDLVRGPWTIIVEALNAGGGTIIGRGVGTVKVNAGKTVPLQVTVLPLEGFGNFQITVSWDAAGTTNPQVSGQLLPPLGSPIDLSFTNLGPGTAACSAADIGSGYYCLTVEVRDSDVLAVGSLEAARIVADQTTPGVVDLTQVDPADGKIAVNLTPSLVDPITVTLNGQQATLASGAEMTVTAAVPQGTGNVACAWFLNGISESTGSSFTVGTGLEPGAHLLEVSVFSADGQRTGAATHSFQVTPPIVLTQATLEWDPNSEADLAGYKLHYGLASGNYTNVVDVGNVTTYTLSGLQKGITYFITATAYNTSGQESAYSNEVTFDGI